jgi:hypothetical protein
VKNFQTGQSVSTRYIQLVSLNLIIDLQINPKTCYVMGSDISNKKAFERIQNVKGKWFMHNSYCTTISQLIKDTSVELMYVRNVLFTTLTQLSHNSSLALCGSYMWNPYNVKGLCESWVRGVVGVSLLYVRGYVSHVYPTQYVLRLWDNYVKIVI